MEPIPLAASIFGLIDAGKNAIRFIASMADAPQPAQNVLREVQTLQTIFRRLQKLISDRDQQCMSRREKICLDDLVATLTGCVCVFSELDVALERLGALDGLIVGRNSTVWDKTKWAATEESIQKILVNLQMNKISLQSMLSIYSWFVTHLIFDIVFLGHSFPKPILEVVQVSDVICAVNLNSGHKKKQESISSL